MLQTRLFVTDLTHIDCAHLNPVRGLLGESWTVDAELGGELDSGGMICDFGVVKKVIKATLDELVDHRLLIAAGDVTELNEANGSVEVIYRTHERSLVRYRAPEQAICMIDAQTTSLHSLAEALTALVKPRLPDNVDHLALQLTANEQPRGFRYCHGLKRHDGNCQRMAHGHRARLSIQLERGPGAELEEQWAGRLDGRFVGHAADRVGGAADGYERFGYHAAQGEFELEVPAEHAYVIDSEATVECISAHIAERVYAEHPDQIVKVIAYEGIGKGAVSIASPD